MVLIRSLYALMVSTQAGIIVLGDHI